MEWIQHNAKNIKTAIGDVVSMNVKTFDHIISKKKERAWRLRNLALAVETLKNPQEVWQGYNGNKVYISKYLVDVYDNKTREYVKCENVVITVTNGDGKYVITEYAEKNDLKSMERYRAGKLLYRKESLKL